MGFVIVIKNVKPLVSIAGLGEETTDEHKWFPKYIENIINAVTDKFGLLVTYTERIEEAWIFETLAQAKKQVESLKRDYTLVHNAVLDLDIIEYDDDEKIEIE